MVALKSLEFEGADSVQAEYDRLNVSTPYGDAVMKAATDEIRQFNPISFGEPAGEMVYGWGMKYPRPAPSSDNSTTMNITALKSIFDGHWTGIYTYNRRPSQKDPPAFFHLQLGIVSRTACSFSGNGEDGCGRFSISGAVFADDMVQMVKSYSGHKWRYTGKLDRSHWKIFGAWGDRYSNGKFVFSRRFSRL